LSQVAPLSSDPMNLASILIWNARDLNNKARRDAAREVITSCKADIICLQETKVANMSFSKFISACGSEFDKFVTLPAIGTWGGVLIAWKSSICLTVASRVDNLSASVVFAKPKGRNL
jgi:exonuclease III